MEWININDKLPKVPENKFGVIVLVAMFDSVYEDINPGKGYSITTMSFCNPNDSSKGESFGEFVELLSGKHWMQPSDEVTHWMPMPDPPNKCACKIQKNKMEKN